MSSCCTRSTGSPRPASSAAAAELAQFAYDAIAAERPAGRSHVDELPARPLRPARRPSGDGPALARRGAGPLRRPRQRRAQPPRAVGARDGATCSSAPTTMPARRRPCSPPARRSGSPGRSRSSGRRGSPLPTVTCSTARQRLLDDRRDGGVGRVPGLGGVGAPRRRPARRRVRPCTSGWPRSPGAREGELRGGLRRPRRGGWRRAIRRRWSMPPTGSSGSAWSLLAAEAANEAAQAFQRRGERREATALEARAAALAAACEGAVTPGVDRRGRGLAADAARARHRDARGPWRIEPGHRRAAGRLGAHRRQPPAERVHEARHQRPPGAAGRAGAGPGSTRRTSLQGPRQHRLADQAVRQRPRLLDRRGPAVARARRRGSPGGRRPSCGSGGPARRSCGGGRRARRRSSRTRRGRGSTRRWSAARARTAGAGSSGSDVNIAATSGSAANARR